MAQHDDAVIVNALVRQAVNLILQKDSAGQWAGRNVSLRSLQE
jgi:hypothetical protein